MLDFGTYEDHISGGYLAVFLPILGAGFETGASADYIVDLVFEMRPLPVGRSGGQDVESSAHRRHAEKFSVQLATLGSRAVDFGDVRKQRFQAKIPPKMSSVNCGIRLCVCRSPSGLYHW